MIKNVYWFPCSLEIFQILPLLYSILTFKKNIINAHAANLKKL